MKGVVYLGESEVEVREFPVPEPGPGEVLVESKVAGLCGSDLHKYHNTREWAAERNGMISGHEPTGVVAGLGVGVSNVAVGDRVCVYHSLGCGHCPVCLAGTPVFCANEGAFGRTRDGSHADFVLTDARFCLPLPEQLSFAVGAQLACTAGTAFSALQKIPIRSRGCLVVFGLGPVGLTALLMAKASGFETVGFDVSPYRIDLANRLGAGAIHNAGDVDPEQVVADMTDGKGACGVIECSGSDIARTQSAAVAARHATVVFVGAGGESITVVATYVIHKELTIKGNSVYSMPAYFDAVDFLLKHSVPLDDMVTHRFRLDQAVEAFKLFDTGQTGKVIFDWEM